MRYYYAQYCPYGILSMSGGDRLHRFATESERDEWVSLNPIRHMPLTDEDAERWYPNAFGEHAVLWGRSDGHDVWLDSPTGGSYEFL